MRMFKGFGQMDLLLTIKGHIAIQIDKVEPPKPIPEEPELPAEPDMEPPSIQFNDEPIADRCIEDEPELYVETLKVAEMPRMKIFPFYDPMEFEKKGKAAKAVQYREQE